MYKFKQIETSYQFTSCVTFAKGPKSVYSAIEEIIALTDWGGGFNFFLNGSRENTLNGEPAQGFDQIMLRTGKALYPVELNVSKDGIVRKVNNYPEVSRRWEAERKSIIDEYKKSYFVERYLNISSKGLLSEQTLLASLKRNSFVQLLFMAPAQPSQRFTVYDFPKSGNQVDIEFDLHHTGNEGVHYKASLKEKTGEILSGDGALTCTYSEKGMPKRLSLELTFEVANEGYYNKRILVEQIEKTTKKQRING